MLQQNWIKIGDKEGEKDKGEYWIQNRNNHLTHPSHKQLTQLRSLDNVTKKTGRHGFESSGLSNSTNDLSRFRTFEKNESMRASSVSDVRMDDAEDKVYIEKVR